MPSTPRKVTKKQQLQKKPFKWPEKVTILGYEYTIDYTTLDKVNSFNDVYRTKGTGWLYGDTLFVDNMLPPRARLEVLLHEISEMAIAYTDGNIHDHKQFTRMWVLIVPILLDLGLLNMPEDDDE